MKTLVLWHPEQSLQEARKLQLEWCAEDYPHFFEGKGIACRGQATAFLFIVVGRACFSSFATLHLRIEIIGPWGRSFAERAMATLPFVFSLCQRHAAAFIVADDQFLGEL